MGGAVHLYKFRACDVISDKISKRERADDDDQPTTPTNQYRVDGVWRHVDGSLKVGQPYLVSR